MRYYAPGVNHQAFLLKLETAEGDLYPALRSCLDRPEIYGTAKVQFEMLRHFGYGVTEGSGHNRKYNPYFRKRADLREKFCSVTVPSASDPIGWDPVAAGVSDTSLECGPKIQRKNDADIAAALTGDRDAVFHAIAADPLTAAVLGLDEIRAMTDELFAALASEIDPRFNARR